MGIRVGTVSATVAVLFFSVPAVTTACEGSSSGDLGAVSGRAGDTVSFALPGTTEGAVYAVTVEGAAAGGGTDTDPAPGTQASLTIPDLGAVARDAQATVTVSCEEGDGWSSSLTVHYRGRAAVAPAAPVRPAAPAASAPPPTPAAPSPAARARFRSRRGSGDEGALKGVTRSFSGLGPAVVDVVNTRAGKRTAKRRRQPRKPRRPRRAASLDQDGTATPPGPSELGGGGADLNGGDVRIDAPAVAWKLLLAVALAGLATVAAVARRNRRRRGFAG